MIIGLQRGADLHMAQLGSHGQRAVKRVCVCVRVRACVRVCVIFAYSHSSITFEHLLN